MAATKYNKEFRDTAYHQYVVEGREVPEISASLRVPTRTLHNWIAKYGWSDDRERFAHSETSHVRALKQAAIDLTDNLQSPDPKIKVETIKQLSEITQILDRMERRVDHLPVAILLIEDFCRFARRAAEPAYKSEIERVLRAWSDDIKRRWRDAT